MVKTCLEDPRDASMACHAFTHQVALEIPMETQRNRVVDPDFQPLKKWGRLRH